MAYKTTIIDNDIAEKSSAKITAQLQDEAGAGISSASLSALTLTLYVKGYPGSIVNARNKQNVLNINGVTVDTSGNLTYQMTPDDNAIINAGSLKEKHIALFEWTWSAGARAGRHEIEFTVANMENVT